MPLVYQNSSPKPLLYLVSRRSAITTKMGSHSLACCGDVDASIEYIDLGGLICYLACLGWSRIFCDGFNACSIGNAKRGCLFV